MPKWEFIEIVRFSDQVYIVPPGKIDLQWLAQRFPTSRIDGNHKQCLDRVSLPCVRQAGECYSAVLEYAGAQGWQPLALEQPGGEYVSFRRCRRTY